MGVRIPASTDGEHVIKPICIPNEAPRREAPPTFLALGPWDALCIASNVRGSCRSPRGGARPCLQELKIGAVCSIPAPGMLWTSVAAKVAPLGCSGWLSGDEAWDLPAVQGEIWKSFPRPASSLPVPRCSSLNPGVELSKGIKLQRRSWQLAVQLAHLSSFIHPLNPATFSSLPKFLLGF